MNLDLISVKPSIRNTLRDSTYNLVKNLVCGLIKNSFRDIVYGPVHDQTWLLVWDSVFDSFQEEAGWEYNERL